MMAEQGFLVFALVYLIVIGVESFWLFRLHREKKILVARVRNAQRSYENRLKHHETKLTQEIHEREQKIKHLERQLALLKNDEEKRVMQQRIKHLENEIHTLHTQLAAVRNFTHTDEERAAIDPEEFFQLKTQKMELEMQIEELKQVQEQDQALLKAQQLAAEYQQQVHTLQRALEEKVAEIVQLKEERDLLRHQGALLKS